MTTTAPVRSSVPLAVAWFVTALVVGPVGFLLFAMSEASADRLLGLVLAGAGVLAGVVGAAALASGAAVRPWSLALSGGLVVLGGASLATTAFVQDALLLGLPPLVGGVLTGLLALRR